MIRGYIKLWRKTIDDPVFQDANLFKVFTWCLLKATYKVISIPVTTGRGQTIVTLDPGQLIFGRHSASRDLKMPPSSIRDRLERLRKLQILDIKPDTHFSVVTLINWQSYQADDNEEGQATRQATDTQPTQTRIIRTKRIKELSETDLSLFQKFYDTYPVHKGKKAAINAFLKVDLQNGTLEMILSAIESQKVHWNRMKAAGKWCSEWPYPATWLNERRWEDEITPEERGTITPIEAYKKREGLA